MPLSQRDSSEKQKHIEPSKKGGKSSKSTGSAGSRTNGSSAGSAPDAIPALKNFLIGLVVCTLIIIGAVVAVMNGDSLKSWFLNASQGVSGLVPKEKPKAAPTTPAIVDPPPPPKDELYGDDPADRYRNKERQGETRERRPPARKQRMRIE